FGNVVTYACNAGYSLLGTPARACQSDGTFAGVAPTCEPVTCSSASAPTNGSVSSSSATYPNAVTYACDMGYTLTGNGGSNTRSCQANGSFSGTAPTCAPVTCTGIVAPTHGTVSATSATYGDAVTF